MTSGLTFLDMSDTTGVCWYRHGGERLGYTMMISFLGIFPVCLIIHGTGHPVRWALLIPGAVLVAAIAAWAPVPLRAGIGVTPDRILIRTAAGGTTAIPWAQVTGFEGGKGSSMRDSEGMVYVLTSGGERLHTAGYSAPSAAVKELWQLLRALEDERLARMPGAVSTVPALPPPPPAPGKSYAAPLAAGFGVILLIAAGTLPLYFGVTGIGPGLRAASGGGTAGYYIPQRETTGKGGQWYGEFRLPDGAVTRRDTGIEDVSMGALRTGVPVAARDTGYLDGVFPRDDPGAWHGPADMFAGAAWFYTATLVVLIRLRILSRRRDRDDDDDDGNVTAAPPVGHQNLRAHDVRPRYPAGPGRRTGLFGYLFHDRSARSAATSRARYRWCVVAWARG